MKRIYRSSTEKKIAGICGGIGEIWEIDPTIIRLALVFLCLATGVMPLVLTYCIAAWIIPVKPAQGRSSVIS